MRRILLALALALLLLAPVAAQAAEAMKVAVFPFHIFSREPLTDLRDDVQKMLGNKLTALGVTVIPNEEVNQALTAAGQPLDLTLARKVAGRIGADFAITGSITKIGNRVSLDAKVLDVLGMQRPQSGLCGGRGPGVHQPRSPNASPVSWRFGSAAGRRWPRSRSPATGASRATRSRRCSRPRKAASTRRS